LNKQHSLIEFKLAKSTSPKRNLQRQLPIYQEANETRTSVTVIISYTDTETALAGSILQQVQPESSRRRCRRFENLGRGTVGRRIGPIEPTGTPRATA